MQFTTVGDAKWPVLGFGTWQLQGDACREGVEDALSLGYRHIDTAQAYENEDAVGLALRNSGVPRDQVWITTKLWISNLSSDNAERSTRESLARLQTDHVDLLLIHWPTKDAPIDDPLRTLERLQQQGLTRFIGISNFPRRLMREAKAIAPSIITNQVELHPYLAQPALRREAQALGLVLTAYSPLARGRVTHDDILLNIAATHHKTPAQVALRWLIQNGLVVIPKAASPEHRRSNFEIFDFELDENEMAWVNHLDRNERLINPDFAPSWND